MTLMKDMSDLFEEMRQAGFGIKAHGPSKMRVTAPNGDFRFLPLKPTVRSSIRNARAWAKRNGMGQAIEVAETPDPPKRAVPVPSEIFRPVDPPASPQVVRAVPSPPKVAPVPARNGINAPKAESVPQEYKALPETHPAFPLPGSQMVYKGNGAWKESNRPVDAALAASWLKYNQENRPPEQRLVDSWSRTMAEGGWVEEISDPLRFADTGKLLDGQKRLMAVIKSDSVIRFDVVTGLPESAQDVMDSGQHRSVAHQLSINGFQNSMIVASASRLLWMWEKGSLVSQAETPSNAEQLDYVLELVGDGASIEKSATLASTLAKLRLLAPSVVASCHYKMCLADQAAAEEFWNSFYTGANMPDKSPILALRETMLRRKDGGRKPKPAEQVFLVGRAWTIWRKGGTASRLQLPESLTMEAIPEIV